MKIIKKIIKVITSSLAIFFMVDLLLPNSWESSHAISMTANKENIYELVANLSNWKRWSVMDEASTLYNYEGPPYGRGAERRWSVPHLGTGYLKILEADQNSGISYYIVFIKDNRITSTSTGEISFKANGNQTKVVWTEHGGSRDIIEKLMHLLFGMLQANMMVDSLQLLKRIVEAS